MKAVCDQCRRNTDTTMRAQKLNPVNWHPDIRRLCKHCRVKLGYQPVNTARPYGEANSRTGGRPW